MGRHSVPDDEDGEETAHPTVPVAPVAGGAVDVAGGALDVAGGAVDVVPEPVDVAEPPRPAPGPDAARRGHSGTAEDLELLRRDRALRARAAAAAIAPMFLYALVLLVMRRFDVFLIWVWVPVVLSGVLVGALLDRAHAARRRLSPGPPDQH